jgi:FkbM family methyltransferase
MYYGVELIDKKIIEKYLNYENGFFIEVGGNDGITQSNTAHLEYYKGWNGLLIEPITNKFNQMVLNRPKSICVNTCLSNIDDSEIEFVDVNLMSFVKNSRKSDENDNNWIKEGENCQNIKSIKYILKTKKLQTIIEENKITKIDFFSLDVEGYEKEVLEGINLDVFNIDYILIETNYFDKINLILKNYNYILLKKLSFNDYLYKKNINLKNI